MFAWIDAEKAEFTLRNRIAADDTGRRRPRPASLWGQRTRSSLAPPVLAEGRDAFTGKPASASLRNPMICASLNRFFTFDLLPAETEL